MIVLTCPWFWIAFTCFSPCSSIVFICFSNAFCKGEYVNLPFSVICCWLDGNISLPVRYSYLPILPDDKADILAAFLLISYCSFSSLTWSSMILLYIYFRWFFEILKIYLMVKLYQQLKKNTVQQYIFCRS